MPLKTVRVGALAAPLFDNPPPQVQTSEAEPRRQSVGELTSAIKQTLEQAFAEVIVEGEISNFTDHRSGHRYFTLKDSSAQISCVFWKTRQASFKLRDGVKVICRGRVTLYAPRGNYQLDVLQIRPVGIGELQQAYEALFAKLRGEGLFDPSRKRELPAFPERIGIVTSATGAALHDMLTVFRRRYPIVQVLLRPAAVQGVGAELQIARAIQEFNLLPVDTAPELLIVGRGGGSLEDLWAFNEEAVARAIFSSKIPIVSAVGHEVDYTIADYVADLRAATPTAAAELVTPDRDELIAGLLGMSAQLGQIVMNRLHHLRRDLEHRSIGRARATLAQRFTRFARDITTNKRHIETIVSHSIERKQLALERDAARLHSLSPMRVLERGFAIVEDDAGTIIQRSTLVRPNSDASLRFADGTIPIKFLRE